VFKVKCSCGVISAGEAPKFCSSCGKAEGLSKEEQDRSDRDSRISRAVCAEFRREQREAILSGAGAALMAGAAAASLAFFVAASAHSLRE